MIDITAKPCSVQIWANSHHIVDETLHNLEKLTEQDKKVLTPHKEERRTRVISEQNFRNLCQPVSTILTHLKELCNIYTGETCSEKTNVNKFYEIRTEFMLEFQRGLPEGFYSRLSSRVISMVKGKGTKKKDEIVEMYNTELIF